MEADILPIKFQEHAQLQQYGINPSFIGFNTLTMESDKFICVRESVGEQNQIAIIDMNDPSNLIRRPISADSAIMHPESKILALKAGKQLQIFNTELKSKIKSHVIHEEILFWKWVNSGTIGMVSKNSVYHWSLEGQSIPVKVFDRHASLSGSQIINYRVSKDEKWMLLMGILSKENRIAGAMQLYSKERSSSQPIEGHVGAFGEVLLGEGEDSPPVKVFVFASRTTTTAKLHMVEIDHPEGTPAVYVKRAVDIFFPPEATNDFPVAMQISNKYALVFIITKYGFLHIYDLETGTCVYMNRISSETIFVSTEYSATAGIIGVNRKGQVLSISVDDDTIVPYIRQVLQKDDLAMRLAIRNNLPGASDLISNKFHALISNGSVIEAAKLAATSPQGVLRTPDTIETLKGLGSSAKGQLSPLLHYFGILLEKSVLNTVESIELVRPVLLQNRKSLLEKWLKEEKLECSESLGDLVKPYDPTLALSIYLRASIPEKVIECFVETGQYNKIIIYAKKLNYNVGYLELFEDLVKKDSEASLEFAKMLLTANKQDISKSKDSSETDLFAYPSLLQLATVYKENNLVVLLTTLLLDQVTDKEEEGPLQTLLLESNLLLGSPQVASAIISRNLYTHYDRSKISKLLESNGLYQLAIETQPADNDSTETYRLIVEHISDLDSSWLVATLLKKNNKELLCSVLDALLVAEVEYMPLINTLISSLYHIAGVPWCIAFYERHGSYDGLFTFLSSILSSSKDPQIHNKYLEAAILSRKNTESIIKHIRTSSYYTPEVVFNLIIHSNSSDRDAPLLALVTKHEKILLPMFIDYCANSSAKTMDLIPLLLKMQPTLTADVISGLLDNSSIDDQFTRSLLSSSSMPTAATLDLGHLINVLEKRGKLTWLLPILEKSIETSSVDNKQSGNAGKNIALCNALAKIHVDNTIQAEENETREGYSSFRESDAFEAAATFLKTNAVYDGLLLGKYCEDRGLNHLALLAFAKDGADAEVLRLGKTYSLHEIMGTYVLQRKNASLWDRLLSSFSESESNIDSSFPNTDLVDVLTQKVIPASEDAQAVSIAVRAFLKHEALTIPLLELLEHLLIPEEHSRSPGQSPFIENTHLQNLLLMTSLRVDPNRLPFYLQKLSNYSALEIAKVASEQGHLEIAFTVFDKQKLYREAMEILLKLDEDRDGELYSSSRQYAQQHLHDNIEIQVLMAEKLLSIGAVQDAILLLTANTKHLNQSDLIQLSSLVEKVITASTLYRYWYELITYLTSMAKIASTWSAAALPNAASGKNFTNPFTRSIVGKMENALGLAFAKTDQLNQLQELLDNGIGIPNGVFGSGTPAAIDQKYIIGDFCLENESWQGAKICFSPVVPQLKPGIVASKAVPPTSKENVMGQCKFALALIGMQALSEAYTSIVATMETALISGDTALPLKLHKILLRAIFEQLDALQYEGTKQERQFDLLELAGKTSTNFLISILMMPIKSADPQGTSHLLRESISFVVSYYLYENNTENPYDSFDENINYISRPQMLFQLLLSVLAENSQHMEKRKIGGGISASLLSAILLEEVLVILATYGSDDDLNNHVKKKISTPSRTANIHSSSYHGLQVDENLKLPEDFRMTNLLEICINKYATRTSPSLFLSFSIPMLERVTLILNRQGAHKALRTLYSAVLTLPYKEQPVGTTFGTLPLSVPPIISIAGQCYLGDLMLHSCLFDHQTTIRALKGKKNRSISISSTTSSSVTSIPSSSKPATKISASFSSAAREDHNLLTGGMTRDMGVSLKHVVIWYLKYAPLLLADLLFQMVASQNDNSSLSASSKVDYHTQAHSPTTPLSFLQHFCHEEEEELESIFQELFSQGHLALISEFLLKVVTLLSQSTRQLQPSHPIHNAAEVHRLIHWQRILLFEQGDWRALKNLFFMNLTEPNVDSSYSSYVPFGQHLVGSFTSSADHLTHNATSDYSWVSKLKSHRHIPFRRLACQLSLKMIPSIGVPIQSSNGPIYEALNTALKDCLLPEALSIAAASNDSNLLISVLLPKLVKLPTWFLSAILLCKSFCPITSILFFAWKVGLADLVFPIVMEQVGSLEQRIFALEKLALRSNPPSILNTSSHSNGLDMSKKLDVPPKVTLPRPKLPTPTASYSQILQPTSQGPQLGQKHGFNESQQKQGKSPAMSSSGPLLPGPPGTLPHSPKFS